MTKGALGGDRGKVSGAAAAGKAREIAGRHRPVAWVRGADDDGSSVDESRRMIRFQRCPVVRPARST